MDLRYFATQHIPHGALLVGHKTAVWAVQLEGTAEPLIRILVEGPDKKKITHIADELASFLEKQIS